MSSDDIKNVDIPSGKVEISYSGIPPASVALSEDSSTVSNVQSTKGSHLRATSTSTERQIKFDRAHKCLENAALVTKRIKEHRKATAELLGKPFEEDDCDTASEMTSTMSERTTLTSYSQATDTSATLSVQEALNIPGISESLANTLKQKELLMERIKQYKEISKRPIIRNTSTRKPETNTIYPKKEIVSKDISELQSSVKEKENAISILSAKMRSMEGTIMDLQEKIGEKDMVIEAKTKATSLMSDNLSKKERDSLSLLEDTRHQMLKMQENFIAMESEWTEEKFKLKQEINEQGITIKNLQVENDVLEKSNIELNGTKTKIIEELNEKNKEISELQNKLLELSDTIKLQNVVNLEISQEHEEKGALEIANMGELSKRVELLEQLNCQIRQTNKELENRLAMYNTDTKSVSSSPKKSSPISTRKGGRNTSTKSKSPWSNISETSSQELEKKGVKTEISKMEMVIQSLNKEILDKEFVILQKNDFIKKLEENISQFTKASVNVVFASIETQTENKDEVKEGVIAHEISNTPNDLENKFKLAEEKIIQLNNEIDTSNKNMVKVKSNHKIKIKQLQKTIDNFSVMSDSNATIKKLNEEVHQLTQKVAELEEEKGNLQLHLVDYDSGRLTESDTYKKLIEIEALAESRLNAISILETQKFDLVQELHVLQQKNVQLEDKLADLSNLQNEHVCSEIQSLEMEEQLDTLIAQKQEIILVNENLKLDKEQMAHSIDQLELEKEELSQKLENYIQENIELSEKLEKLSTEKVSSAESIEIVESLTAQERLELEEYSKSGSQEKVKESREEAYILPQDINESLHKLTEESSELNKKIELFTLERQEVMAKMNAINTENETLQIKILSLTTEMNKLENIVENLNTEKHVLQSLNMDLNIQIENLKREHTEIIKEVPALSKPLSLDEEVDSVVNDLQQDDKASSDKGIKSKSIKQLTKDILKLKNVIKERENEIADCQMKILSLEEQQQKQKELMQNDVKLKTLNEEKELLLDELNALKQDGMSENIILVEEMNKLKQENDKINQELTTIRNEYNEFIITRDGKIRELENVLLDYEQQLYNYSNTLQSKDKQLSEYMNQITKLNDVSQKLKSTIESLEEEKEKDQNAELVKSLNKQLSIYQKRLTDYEDNLKHLEEEKAKLASLKVLLETKNTTIESDLQNVQEKLLERQNLIQELQEKQHKYSEDISSVTLQVKERDEEIHEIKLQLRKESIENEKLRTDLLYKEKILQEKNCEIEDNKNKISDTLINKDILERKLTEYKKNITEVLNELKSKNVSNLDVEQKRSEVQNLTNYQDVLETSKLEQMSESQIEVITIKEEDKKQNEILTQEQQKHNIEMKEILDSETEFYEYLSEVQMQITNYKKELQQVQLENSNLEQRRLNDVIELQEENTLLEKEISLCREEILKITHNLDVTNSEFLKSQGINAELNSKVDLLSNRLVELEIEKKDTANVVTKLNVLETELSQKQANIRDLLNKIESLEENCTKMQFSFDAKIQERDLYIENLESEITKYKNRIARLEESISEMEDRRHSLERKADQLDVQLQEKHKAYHQYASQEDELINRLAVLMDHDRVVEKQLHEIENDNKELQTKIQDVNEDNIKLRKTISDIQSQFEVLTEKASKTDYLEAQLVTCTERIKELEYNLKKVSADYQTVIVHKKKDIEDLESEFNIQIENSIKEKKALSEKYEKTNEHIMELERKLTEYKTMINNLNINLDEMSKLNHQLIKKSEESDMNIARDYTEQYVSEINKLNSLVNTKNQEIVDVNEKMRQFTITYNNNILTTEKELDKCRNELSNSSNEIGKLNMQILSLTHINDKLKEENEQLMENKTVMSFEMNIPKTDGMVISSTIEELTANSIGLTTPSSMVNEEFSMVSESIENQKIQKGIPPNSKEAEEPTIVPKKSYLCYESSKPHTEDKKMYSDMDISDPFNSDEGWGFEETAIEEHGLMMELTQLNEQALNLKKENEKLLNDLESNNSKLTSAYKKIKDLKANNVALSNELKLSQKLSQSSFLDSTIEDELKVQIQELDRKINELQTKLNTEKRENDSLKKQNMILGTANDRLTEIKEKLDSEIEIWKFKFKEANDRSSSLQWGSESKEPLIKSIRHIDSHDEVTKLEKENDELQSNIEQLTKQNNELSLSFSRLRDELTSIKIKENENKRCSACQLLQERLLCLEDEKNKLNCLNDNLTVKLQDLEQDIELNQHHSKELAKTCELLKSDVNELNIQIAHLKSELQDSFQNLDIANKHIKDIEITTLNQALQIEDNCVRNVNIEDITKKNTLLEKHIEELIAKVKSHEDDSEEISQRMEKLNIENDHLLSTVAELRSTLSSAVDQRGYEIAEMWKQHLTQREADFANIECDLRSQLISSEEKYEQLLDDIQSSSQEQTNQLVIFEQVNTLQNKLKDKEEHLSNLQNKYSELLNQMDILRGELEDERIMYEDKLLHIQDENYKKVNELTDNNQLHTNAINEVLKLEEEIASCNQQNLMKDAKINDISSKLTDIEMKHADIMYQMTMKDSEISQKSHEFTALLSERNEQIMNVRQQLSAYEKKLEDLSFEKESDLAILRLKIHENNSHYSQKEKEFEEEKNILIQSLNSKISECVDLNKDITNLNNMLQERTVKMTEMQTALENQEIEIVTLKDEISNLQDLLEISTNKIEKHVTFSPDTKKDSVEHTQDNELLDPVPRAELDLALYMLHQRDVRCEELTMELTQLLEERDTLQLRLSDSLRSFEELKTKSKLTDYEVSTTSHEFNPDSLIKASDRVPQFVNVHTAQGSRSGSVTEADADKPKLQAKLSELRTVKHSRDVRFRNDSEQREMNMRLLQRDVANLPPEAAEQLRQAHHTLSRDTQSTSTVLLNWLRGKSTPKVVHM